MIFWKQIIEFRRKIEPLKKLSLRKGFTFHIESAIPMLLETKEVYIPDSESASQLNPASKNQFLF